MRVGGSPDRSSVRERTPARPSSVRPANVQQLQRAPSMVNRPCVPLDYADSILLLSSWPTIVDSYVDPSQVVPRPTVSSLLPRVPYHGPTRPLTQPYPGAPTRHPPFFVERDSVIIDLIIVSNIDSAYHALENTVSVDDLRPLATMLAEELVSRLQTLR